MKKIIWVSDFPMRGSSFGNVTYELLTRMPKDYSFEVLSLGYDGMPLKLTDNLRIFELKKASQLRYYYKKLKPDISVVFHSYWLLDSMMSEIDNMTGKRILYLPLEGESIPIQYRKHFYKFDTIATPSVFSQRIMKKCGINATVIPHGVDSTFFTPKAKAKDWHEFTFGYIGLNDIRKQVPRIMEAYARLGQGVLKLAVNAEGHYDLIQLAKEYKIAPIFVEAKLNGLSLNKEAVRDFLQSLDVYVAPASESFGLPGLEAQACGVPSISNSHGAAKEVLGNGAIYCSISDYLETSIGKIGLVSTADLYRKMRFMIQVKEAYEKVATKALENSKKWSWEKSVKAMIEVFQ